MCVNVRDHEGEAEMLPAWGIYTSSHSFQECLGINCKFRLVISERFDDVGCAGLASIEEGASPESRVSPATAD